MLIRPLQKPSGAGADAALYYNIDTYIIILCCDTCTVIYHRDTITVIQYCDTCTYTMILSGRPYTCIIIMIIIHNS